LVNDRVNCNEVYYFLDIQTPYKLTTFFVCCSGFHGKTFYLLRQGGGLAEGEAPRVQHRKIFKIDVSEDCIIGKKSGLRRNPLGQHVRTFGDIFVKRYIKAIYL